VGGEQKPVAEVGAGVRGEVVCVLVEILIGPRTNDVTGAQRVPIFFRRSSNWRCLFSQ